MPFLGVTLFDLGSCVLCLICIMFGFGNPRPEADQDNESNLSGSIDSDNTEELGATPILSKMESHSVMESKKLEPYIEEFEPMVEF